MFFLFGNELIKGAPITYSTAGGLKFYVKALSHYLPKNVSINLISPGNILLRVQFGIEK